MKNDKITCAYIYADGHSIEIHEKTDKNGISYQYAVSTSNYCKTSLSIGRYTFHEPSYYSAYDLCKNSNVSHEADIKHLMIYNKNGKLLITSAGMCLQPYAEFSEIHDPSATTWEGYKSFPLIHRKA